VKRNSESGQTIIIVAFVMVLALALGVSIASGFVERFWEVSSSDASYRAVAVAEAAIERILVIPNETLLDYIQFGTCGTDCQLSVTGSDGVTAEANVTLSIVGDTPDPYMLSLREGYVSEVSLVDYPDNTSVYVCWDSPSGELPSLYATHVYGESGSYDSESYAYNSIGSAHSDNNFDTAASSFGYGHCFTVSGEEDPYLLRLRAFYNDVDVFIVPAGGVNVPSQGILIESVGQVARTEKKVTVVKSPPYLPLPFDFVLYQKSDSEPLSN
jgi:hypothetical protein